MQALVTVVYDGTGHILDVHVFNNITAPAPTEIFKLLGLYAGDAKISAYNTILSAEVDNNSAINKNKPNAGLQRDLFREFKWSDQLTTLVPVAFPAFFPDLTRYQAELDQGQVNQGQQAWKLSATQTAQMFAASDHFLKWGSAAAATIVSGGGAHDVSAVVSVKSGHPVGGGSAQISMSRLEGNTNGGIWEITSVTSNGMSIGAPTTGGLQSSPVTISGAGNAFEGKIGTVTVLDHLYNDIGHSDANGASGNGHTTFSSNVTYHSDFQGGSQEGVIVLVSFSQANGAIAGMVTVKVLLGK
ncbi:MAG: Gmad2 immunoglobulin-like domain-containing protein [Chloroflexota bacterium]|nr:Gmad2 immunoglobulin-like domain-containing protein [Chloroflexota bacterium]